MLYTSNYDLKKVCFKAGFLMVGRGGKGMEKKKIPNSLETIGYCLDINSLL